MKRSNFDKTNLTPNFIGSWIIEPLLCDDIITYYEKNKHWLNANRREKRKLNKKPKSKFKNCTSCGKRL